MNKDVIYIEPEDDITDILAKLKNTKEKIVALVPPKKPGVLRSAVNIKLIAKTAKAAEKVVVLVTIDPALIKLAAMTQIPVAKNLQSRPEIPTVEAVAAGAAAGIAAEQVIEDDLSDKDPEKKAAPSKEKQIHSTKNKLKPKKVEEFSDDDLEEKPKKKKKVPSMDKKRKWIIIGSVCGVLLIAFLVWAIAFAPSARVVVSVRTSATNFSENVNFTLKDADENIDEGKFFLEEQKIEQKSTVQFEATGQKDVGTKANGTLAITATFKEKGSISIPVGASFTYNGLRYDATGGASISWDGDDSSCESGSSISSGCKKSTTVSIEAAENGEKYNIGAQTTGWASSIGTVVVHNPSGISGGTTKMITVVQQSDIEKAKSELTTGDADESKKALISQFKDGALPIEASFTKNEGNVMSSPAVGEEVKDGAKPTLTLTTEYKMMAVDKTRVEQFIENKSNIPDDQKIYSKGDPYFEKFTEDGNGGYSAKLKTTTQIGPKITDEDILNKAKGKRVGEVQSLLKSINGVSNVEVKTSFFWVGSVPDDANKVQVEMKVDED